MSTEATELLNACISVVIAAAGIGLGFGVIAGLIRDGFDH